MHLGSSHLYESNLEAACAIRDEDVQTILSPHLQYVPPEVLHSVLCQQLPVVISRTEPVIRQYQRYAKVLVAATNHEALTALSA
jgi:hypothetical protein